MCSVSFLFAAFLRSVQASPLAPYHERTFV
nr:MAG TPA: hypothetical protein [Caudoviricetes sp.]